MINTRGFHHKLQPYCRISLFICPICQFAKAFSGICKNPVTVNFRGQIPVHPAKTYHQFILGYVNACYLF